MERQRAEGDGGDVKVVSMSLWGSDPRYVQGVVENARLMEEVYPGWKMVVYSEARWIPMLEALGVYAFVVEGWGMFNRFRAGNDLSAERVVFRDADSRINWWEAGAVRAWEEGGRAFHVMRDEFWHWQRWPVMGGMWGHTREVMEEVAAELDLWTEKKQYDDDQRWLKERVCPIMARRGVLVHSSRGRGEGVPFPRHAPCGMYVGERVTVGKRRE